MYACGSKPSTPFLLWIGSVVHIFVKVQIKLNEKQSEFNQQKHRDDPRTKCTVHQKCPFVFQQLNVLGKNNSSP